MLRFAVDWSGNITRQKWTYLSVFPRHKGSRSILSVFLFNKVLLNDRNSSGSSVHSLEPLSCSLHCSLNHRNLDFRFPCTLMIRRIYKTLWNSYDHGQLQRMIIKHQNTYGIKIIRTTKLMIQLFLVTLRMEKTTWNHHLSCPIFLFRPNRVREKDGPVEVELWSNAWFEVF